MKKQYSDKDKQPTPIVHTAAEIRAMLEQDHRTPEEERVRLFKTHARLLLASIRGKNYSDNDPALLEAMQEAYDSWFQQFKFRFAGADIGVLEQEYIRDQRYKLTSGDLMLHDTDIRVNVRRFLQFLDDKEKALPSYRPQKEKKYKSLPRVQCFILAKAHLDDGHTLIKTCPAAKFKEGVIGIFGANTKPLQHLYMVRSCHKGDNNYLQYFDELRAKYPLDYGYAMMIYDKYYPHICKYFPKSNQD